MRHRATDKKIARVATVNCGQPRSPVVSVVTCRDEPATTNGTGCQILFTASGRFVLQSLCRGRDIKRQNCGYQTVLIRPIYRETLLSRTPGRLTIASHAQRCYRAPSVIQPAYGNRLPVLCPLFAKKRTVVLHSALEDRHISKGELVSRLGAFAYQLKLI